jgi:3-oxoacyl-[acyl-carrier-protein] synthase-3
MPASSRIEGIATYLPNNKESNFDLEKLFPEWSATKISDKTGIHTRHIADRDEFTSHLASRAGQALFKKLGISPESIDQLILVTQSPDFVLPQTSSIVHELLGLPESAGAMDINLGCSGYVVALSIANAYIESGTYKNILLITSDTYSKLLNQYDKSVRTIFGDGATATLIVAHEGTSKLSSFVQGTNGKGAKSLIVPNGGLRPGNEFSPGADADVRNLTKSNFDLYMDGAAIFNFTLDVVSPTISRILNSEVIEEKDVDFFVFHQANKFMLDHLVKKSGLPPEKCPVLMSDWGNTVSSTIPMALEELIDSGRLRRGMKSILLGFGVGLAWAGILLNY